MRRHAIILRIGSKDAHTVGVGSDVDVTTEIPFLTNELPASDRITHEKLCKNLLRIGLVPPERAIDLLAVAVTVFAADTHISRSRDSQDGWTREIDLHVPVENPIAWTNIAGILQEALHFLTGDFWRFSFRPRPKMSDPVFAKSNRERPYETDTVCLFSGGLDSFIGALDLLEAGIRPILVGHHKSPDVSAPQEKCYECVSKAYPSACPELFNAYLRVPKTLFSGSEEKTERGRSFLFLSLGTLAASSLGGNSRLVVPENGLISLNVPLTPLRFGALSTRTTHPYFMLQFQKIVDALNLGVHIENPYQFKTKGEMLAECKNQKILRACVGQTMSCAHPTARRFKKEPMKHCGKCMPCLIRRAAIYAALKKDPTPYAIDVIKDDYSHDSGAAQDIRALQIALARLEKRPNIAEIMIHKPGPLPVDADRWKDFADVYMRGMQELRNLFK